MINPANLKKLRDVWKRFSNKHSDLVAFGKSLYPDALQNKTLFAIYAKTPDDKTYEYYLEFDAEDVQMADEVKQILKKK